eukprot:COSAG05_NODE_901_length_6665_cov_4.080262_1_plen_62_part_10
MEPRAPPHAQHGARACMHRAAAPPAAGARAVPQTMASMLQLLPLVLAVQADEIDGPYAWRND